jgi:hypothetical protein
MVLAAIAVIAFSVPVASAQSAQQQPTPSTTPDQPSAPAGKVLFSRDASTPQDAQPDQPPPPPAAPLSAPTAGTLAVADAERSALTFTVYDLDVHLTPATAGISVRAGVTVRNDSAQPLRRLILQISSTLHWDAFSSRISGSAPAALAFAAHLVLTDADHTGSMSEAIVTLPQALAPGASLSLNALYSGSIQPSADRLIRIGAPAAQALAEDWDAVAPNNPGAPGDGTALRGFGNVLWYPVSAPPVFLGDGANLFQSVGHTKLRGSAASIRLRLAVEYVGDPPDAAFFCGRRAQLIAISDNANVPISESPGIATATFEARPVGFRTPSLFITGHAAADAGTPTNSNLIAAVTNHDEALPAYTAAATLVEPLLTDWFGAQPLDSLTILDHQGQPFEDDALLVTDLARAAQPDSPTQTLAPALVHSLTHAWIRSSHAWIDEGLAQFASLLWTERASGRTAALSQLQDQARDLALAEPEVPASVVDPTNSPSSTVRPQSSSSSSSSSSEPAGSSDQPPTAAPSVSPAGTSLADATGEVFYRTKAAAVWWMLRTIVGDEVLKQTLQAYRKDPALDHDPTGFERTLAKYSHMELHWFFENWVYQDRGLPDLRIVSVTPSHLETSANPRAGWLVAVVVHNDGYAEAEVPVTVRSATSTQTQMLRIPGRSTASTRVVFAGTPQQVQVNDGGVPETETSIHTRQLVVPGVN